MRKKVHFKIIALLTVLVMLFALAACGGTPPEPVAPPTPAPATPAPVEVDPPEDEDPPDFSGLDFGGREFVILTWMPSYQTTDPDPGIEDPEYDGQGWDNIQRIYNSYNGSVRYEEVANEDLYEYFVINMLAGSANWDAVNIPRENFISAVLADFLYPMEEVVPADDPFWLNNRTAWSAPAGFGPDGKHYGIGGIGNTLPWSMTYNRNIIQAAGLEDPADIYDRGDWTWDVFVDYLRELTTLGADGTPNQWGLSGAPDKILRMMLATNDGAMVDTNTLDFALDSPNSMRAFEFFDQVIVQEQLNKPFVDSWTDWGTFDEGDVAFWVNEHWFIWVWGNLQWDEDIAVAPIPFPRGPNNSRGYTQFDQGDTGLSIPRGVADPYLVFRMYDEMGMAYRYFSNEAFDSPTGEATIEQFINADMDYLRMVLFTDDERDPYRIADAWNNLGKFEWGERMDILQYDDVLRLATGEVTAAQFIEEVRPVLNDILDDTFGHLRQ